MLAAVVLIAVVGAAIGAVTTFALRQYLVEQLDDQLRASLTMATRGPGAGKAAREGSLGFVLAGTPPGAAGIRLDENGKVIGTARNAAVGGPELDHRQPLTEAQSAALAKAARKAGQGLLDRWTWTCRISAATGCSPLPTGASFWASGSAKSTPPSGR